MFNIITLCKPGNEQAFLSLEQVSEILNISQETLLLWQSEKRGPKWYNFHGVPRYLTDDLQNFIRSSLQLALPTPFWAIDPISQDNRIRPDCFKASQVAKESKNI